MTHFTEVDGESCVYRVESGGRTVHLPAKAKSLFAEERDVEYDNLRATSVKVGGERFVIVGEIDD